MPIFFNGAERTENINKKVELGKSRKYHVQQIRLNISGKGRSPQAAIDLFRKKHRTKCGASTLSTINYIMNQNTCSVTTSNCGCPF